ncbi:UvrD-helicase domain-containing protein [Xenorhabdus anantnagensis]|uniref:DNA 3'-5' helicase II n=1 Tax=Xenorhabdus anantnagensis TaxID=3025875 RepID=A0ABT5M0L8_9GAMM|nr:ATP-dependent helicase [Xenorhabdus anantnagensis]MDC9598864.1 ATP-dependent helicase [Xenorhabdus anantnagensis]
MAQSGLRLEPEVIDILRYVSERKNFLLSGGAGSGKTYSLVQVIGELLRIDPCSLIACITYTNAAVKEIESRISSKRLSVSTIHDFLWDAIKPYQNEMRTVLIKLMDGEAPKIKSGNTIVSKDMFEGKSIEYKEFRILEQGIISHDEIIILAQGIFEKYPKIRNILRDKFRYILVDEYQDTSPEVISILLDSLPLSSRKGICGFFGDSMQSIYDEGVGSIQDYIDIGVVKEVLKEQNRRNPRLIYELANQLRCDGLIQRASNDQSAPNMDKGIIKEGNICFYYSSGEIDKLDYVRKHLNWNFNDEPETKELNLTHNLIAPQAGFGDLMEIYDKDGILAFRDRIVKFIIEHDDLNKYSELTFGEVINEIQKDKIGKELTAVTPTSKMKVFINDHPDLFEMAKKINFHLLRKMYVDKDQLIDDKKQSEDEVQRKGTQRCDFIKHVFKIQTVIHLYEQRRYNDFLRKTEFRLNNANDKVRLKKHIENIRSMKDRPIIEVINFAHEHKLCIKDDIFHFFSQKKEYLFNRLIGIKYASYQKLYEYLEGRTAFSTQHKIKGREFDRVLIVLDSGGWNKYNFNYLFEQTGTETVRLRTQKLFYVCCTRAKESLAVYFRDPSDATLIQAKDWFGYKNIIKI